MYNRQVICRTTSRRYTAIVGRQIAVVAHGRGPGMCQRLLRIMPASLNRPIFVEPSASMIVNECLRWLGVPAVLLLAGRAEDGFHKRGKDDDKT